MDCGIINIEIVQKICYNFSMQKYYEDLILKEEKFNRFKNLLLEYNKLYNLTSITDEEEIFYKHFLDSVYLEKYFGFGADVVEVGSGGGFPSIPLKIIRNDLKFTQIESVGKKCNFLRAAASGLNLSGMNVLNMRAEDCGKDKRYREKFDICTARAVAGLSALSEYCL